MCIFVFLDLVFSVSVSIKMCKHCGGELKQGALTKSRGVVPSWPSVRGGGGSSPPLPVCTIALLVLSVTTQAGLKVTVSWEG